MAAAGYSGTPLIKKLGITENTKVKLVNAPDDYFSLLEKDISMQFCKKNEFPGLVHLFAANKKIFEKEMPALLALCKKNTAITLWVSWYKKNSGITTDLTEDIIRNYALSNNLVDVKVCAVSELWSGLKLVVPLAKRRPHPNPSPKERG